jgi:hypothetical protein
MLHKIYRYFLPLRGSGFSGDGRQKIRSDQMKQINSYFPNQTFIDNFPELLKCNEQMINVAGKLDIGEILKQYHDSIKNWSHYGTPVKNLSDWADSKGNSWPKLHPLHQLMCDMIVKLNPSSVCEIGAGAGTVAKYIYASMNNKIDLTCVEGCSEHLELMKNNFTICKDDSLSIKPNINVKAKIISGIAQNIPLKENEVDLLYTITLQVHIPFVAAVLACCEYARVSKKYIIHIEGHHADGVASSNLVYGWRRLLSTWFPRLRPLLRSKYDGLLIDYTSLYNLLGFKTIKKTIMRDPYSKDYDYIVFVAEKL